MAGLFAATVLTGLGGAFIGGFPARSSGIAGDSGDAEAALSRFKNAAESLESDLTACSPLVTHLRPRLQGWLAGWPQMGTDQVVVGRHGWLFFRPAVEHLTGPSFLSPTVLASPAFVDGDPRPAILDFSSQLRARGIALIVVPVPVKAALEPEHLVSGMGLSALPLANSSMTPFVRELEAAGVLVFEPGPVLADLKRRSGRPVFLAADTHWRPEAVKAVAEELARFTRSHVELPEVPDPGSTTEAVEVEGRGDLVAMLGLAADSRAFAREKVTIEKVIDSDDRLWRLDTGADVLLLGDSFANIYSLPALGWGEAAGLTEHLSLALGRPVDGLFRNGQGAWATRSLLAQELGAGRDRLSGKKVVIWEFASRELSAGSWTKFRVRLGTAGRKGFFVPPPGAPVDVEGTITAMGVVPQARSAPYADYIVALRLSDLESADKATREREAVVFVVAMRDYALTPPAAWRVGQRVAVRLRPWADMADEYGFFTRGELADDSLMLVEPCFGEEVGR